MSIFYNGGNNTIPWRGASWSQRLRLCALWLLLWGVAFPALLIGGLWLLGAVMDGVSRHKTEHDRCLKRATNGYEIKQCR